MSPHTTSPHTTSPHTTSTHSTSTPAGGRTDPATRPEGAGTAGAFHHQIRPARIAAAFALLAAAALSAHHDGVSLWTLAIGVIGPDLSFLAAIGAPGAGPGILPPRAVGPYNAVHHPVGPVTLTAIGTALGAPVATIVGLAWLSHQMWDRGLGYRLRDPDGAIRAR